MSGTVAAIKARAAELDFVACGITDLVPSEHGESLDRWLASGFGGTMRYLHRQAKKRKDPRRIAREARTAVVVLDNYFHTGGDTSAPKVARYARGTDYHRVTIDRLEQLAAQLRHLGAGWTRAFADAGPVPERDLARRAGLGWIGKNTMLIRPGLGSWFFIGTVLTDLVLPADQPQDTDRCGSCTRCLDACPTSAFVEPMVLDATRCISYLTIEHRGEIPADLAPRFEGWGFGCDICNEVCPWNERFAAPSPVEAFRPRRDSPAGRPEVFVAMTEAEFQTRFSDTPFERPGLERMRRNWRVASEGGRG
ncbi:MAG: tRNA epoxyqueuosine(34) reductase QueG [Gemmatimonadales bacterium]